MPRLAKLRAENHQRRLEDLAGTLTLVNSAVSGNTASGEIAQGGGIYQDSGTTKLTNSATTGNTASATNGGSASGGGIFKNTGILTRTNSNVSGNAPDNCFGC